jgi:hypothetical protein
LANGGFDANWHVGYTTCWVVKLPPAPAGAYARAFLGARLGRMKTATAPGRPSWERRPLSGEIDIAVSPSPQWPQRRRLLLTPAEDIPLEGDPDNALEGVGESRWFWVEIPVSDVSTAGDNYVALFSPSSALTDATRAPILAAGPKGGAAVTWLNNGVRGQPPLSVGEALRTPIISYTPAVALRLVPAHSPPPRAAWVHPPRGRLGLDAPRTLAVTVDGRDVESVWLEYAVPGGPWRRVGPPLAGAPYLFTLHPGDLPPGEGRIRAVAQDQWANRGATSSRTVKSTLAEAHP